MHGLEIFGVSKPVIGVVHLLPLPGSPRGTDFETVIRRAVLDSMVLESGGVDGILIENYGDVPYLKEHVDYSTIAYMTAVVKEVVMSVSAPVGVNVLRNAADAAIAIACAAKGKFIRANIWMGAYLTPEGIIEGRCGEVLRYRKNIRCEDIKIYADIRVKHATPLVVRDVTDEVEEYISRGLVDGIIVTGPKTGIAPSPKYIGLVKSAAGETPVLIGSGVNPENAPDLLELADGCIVGTYFKKDGIIENPIDIKRVRKLMRVIEELRKETT